MPTRSCKRILSSEADPDVLKRLGSVEKFALVVAAAIAGSVLSLWFTSSLAAYAPSGWSRMTALATLGALLAVTSLRSHASAVRRRICAGAYVWSDAACGLSVPAGIDCLSVTDCTARRNSSGPSMCENASRVPPLPVTTMSP